MEELVSLGKILSDSNRVRIIALLKRDKELCVCEICDTLELSQPLVSRYLKQMKEANILEATKTKKWIHYSIVKNPDKLVQCYLDKFEEFIPTLSKLISCTKNNMENKCKH